METLGAFLDAVAAAAPEREVVAYAPSDRVTARMTAAALRDASRAAASKLVGLGVTKGTRVGFLCPNRLEWLPIAFGALRIGAVLVPFSTLWKRDEIAYALAHGDVSTLVAVPRFLKHDYCRAAARDRAGARRHRRRRPARTRRPQRCAASSCSTTEAPACRAGTIFPPPPTTRCSTPSNAPSRRPTWRRSSSPRARPRRRRRSCTRMARSRRRRAASPCASASRPTMPGGDTCRSSGAAASSSARSSTLAGGGRIVLQEVVEPGTALALLEAERCTIMAGWHQAGPLLEHPDFARRRLSLRKGTYHALAARLMGPDHQTIGVYGMSETATCVTAARFDDPEPIRTGTFGRAAPRHGDPHRRSGDAASRCRAARRARSS